MFGKLTYTKVIREEIVVARVDVYAYPSLQNCRCDPVCWRLHEFQRKHVQNRTVAVGIRLIGSIIGLSDYWGGLDS